MGYRGFLRWFWRGNKSLIYFNPSDMIYKWKEKQSYTKERSITDFQTLPEDKRESIIGGMTHINRLFRFTDKNGLTILAQFLKGLWFTIKTKILLIIDWIIWNLWQKVFTLGFIQNDLNILRLRKRILNWQGRVLRNGMPRQMQSLGKRNEITRGNLSKKT